MSRVQRANMKSAKIQAAFSALLDTFEPIVGQPIDKDMTRLKSSILQQVVPIRFDGELGKHNLMGLVLSDTSMCLRKLVTVSSAMLSKVESDVKSASGHVVLGPESKILCPQLVYRRAI